MRVVFFGAGDFGAPALRWLANSKHEVVGVVTQPDRPAGRGKKLHPTPIADRALLEGFDLFKCENVNKGSFIDTVRMLDADIGVVADFGQKMSPELCSVFPSECINLHASLLPAYRGASPIAYAILQGESRTGVTVFRLTEQMDTGPILLTRQTAIGPYETQDELHSRLSGVACDALDAALRLHEDDRLPPGQPQDESLASYAPKLRKADGHLHFDVPAEKIALRCRAMWPWPGGRCRFVSTAGKSVDVTICAATASPVSADVTPGMVTDILTVAAGDGTLEIHSIQPAGKKAMAWKDFVNGRHIQAGDRFESLDD